VKALLEHIAIHTGDEDIKYMLAQNSITLPLHPPDGHDAVFIRVDDASSKHVWLVVRFYHPGDDGYMAFGIPNSTPEADIKSAFQFIIDSHPSSGGWALQELDLIQAS